MPWKEESTMSLKKEFISLAKAEGTNISALCKRFGITRCTGYKWLARFEEQGIEGLKEKHRKPLTSPNQTDSSSEKIVIKTRNKHPGWGARKIKTYLESQGYVDIPASSTVHDILMRHGLIDITESKKHKPFSRFEHDAPNDLWQMDFKGHFETDNGRCHPLTILDDHSRFSPGIYAFLNEREDTVKSAMIDVFRKYGLPDRINTDNGPPWGSSTTAKYTNFSVFLIRLGIKVSHSRPHHPQTNGKIERFHRSLKAELLNYYRFRNIKEAQFEFDKWRDCYNIERPHQALEMKTPISRYKASVREFPEKLRAIEYGPDDTVRIVQQRGRISYKCKDYEVGGAFYGEPVALRHTDEDSIVKVYYCHQQIAQIDLKKPRGE